MIYLDGSRWSKWWVKLLKWYRTFNYIVSTVCTITSTGACSEEDRPVEVVRQGDCPTHCPSIEHAICHGGECICRRGYEGVYADGRLHRCNVDDDFAELHGMSFYVFTLSTNQLFTFRIHYNIKISGKTITTVTVVPDNSHNSFKHV